MCTWKWETTGWGETTGLLDGPRSWLYLQGAKALPVEVHFDLPEGWRIATGLDPTPDPKVFTAPDYDRLIDCPTLLGDFHRWDFVVEGIPHVIADVRGAGFFCCARSTWQPQEILYRSQPSKPSAEPNSHMAAGTGTKIPSKCASTAAVNGSPSLVVEKM